MKSDQEKADKLQGLSYEKFRELAKDNSLSPYEKIGFFNEFRQGKEADIFADMLSKLSNLHKDGQRILDIGAGCSDLPKMIIEWCEAKQSELVLADSAEMLDNLPDSNGIIKMAGMFPDDFSEFVRANEGAFDVIIVYSVLHYVVADTSLTRFLDHILLLLKNGGQCLIGDIPNVDKRNRFFSSPNGIAFHRERNQDLSLPELKWNKVNSNEIDDAVVFSILQRSRNSGVEGYVVPQSLSLPMSNRREDILLVKP